MIKWNKNENYDLDTSASYKIYNLLLKLTLLKKYLKEETLSPWVWHILKQTIKHTYTQKPNENITVNQKSNLPDQFSFVLQPGLSFETTFTLFEAHTSVIWIHELT